MRISIQMLPGAGPVAELLIRDGWNVQLQGPRNLSASHPLVARQTEARWRLHQLGLLTMRSLRIEFVHAPLVEESLVTIP